MTDLSGRLHAEAVTVRRDGRLVLDDVSLEARSRAGCSR